MNGTVYCVCIFFTKITDSFGMSLNGPWNLFKVNEIFDSDKREPQHSDIESYSSCDLLYKQTIETSSPQKEYAIQQSYNFTACSAFCYLRYK